MTLATSARFGQFDYFDQSLLCATSQQTSFPEHICSSRDCSPDTYSEYRFILLTLMAVTTMAIRPGSTVAYLCFSKLNIQSSYYQ